MGSLSWFSTSLSFKGLKQRFPCSTFAGYVLGLTATIVVMNVFQAAQPALLYLVPAIIGAAALHSAVKGEFREVGEQSSIDQYISSPFW